MSSAAATILRARVHPFHVTVETPEGPETVTLKILSPGPMQLVAAGMPQVSFSHLKPLDERFKEQGEYLEALAKEEARLEAFCRKLFEACCVEPKFFDGPLAELPEGQLCWDVMEGFAAALFDRLMDLAGYRKAVEAALAAQSFREDAGRAADQPDLSPVRGEAVGAAAGQPG